MTAGMKPPLFSPFSLLTNGNRFCLPERSGYFVQNHFLRFIQMIIAMAISNIKTSTAG